MSEKKVGLRVARVTNEEIQTLRNLLNELDSYGRYYQFQDLKDVIKDKSDDFPVLKDISLMSDDLAEGIATYVSRIRWEMVLFNLDVLLDNCADLEKDTLEFSPRLSRALELLEQNECTSNAGA